MLDFPAHLRLIDTERNDRSRTMSVDAYFSADVETDGPIPGPYSMLSFALVYAGSFDGKTFVRPNSYEYVFYRELKPISPEYQDEALRVNGLDRARLCVEGIDPTAAMKAAADWVNQIAGDAQPVMVAYPLSFDWSWLYWYFTRYSPKNSPFGYSRCFDLKTALAVKSSLPITVASRSKLEPSLRSPRLHTHHAIDDAIEQAEIFANVFEWGGGVGRTP